ncbi:MAG: wax ester/triacylglycerol synthase domain-containing protein [Acidimicrobiales bacterium]|jgi:WS/DGAT/MGAT family acyltransferase
MAPYDDEYMRDADALAWNMEQDPGLRSTIVAVAWLDARPDFAVLSARLERATRLAPRFRQRPVCPPARLSTPQWVHCEFDLSLHLRRIEAPAPYTAATVIEFARCEAMTGFDVSRPLWGFTLVEGLEGDRAALVMKVHHSLTDGVGGMQLAMLVFETTAAPGRVEEVPVPEATPVPKGFGLARGAFGHSVARTVGSVRAAASLVVPSARMVSRHPVRATFDVVSTASSLARFVRPMSDTLSPIMTRRSLDRHLDMLEVDLADLQRAGAVVGSTLNDAFVAAVTGGLRRYHELHGTPVRELRVTMPISLRKADEPAGGNRITLERFAVPVGERDPGIRVRMTGWKCRAARYEEALPLSDAVAGFLNLLPAGVIGSMLKHVDFVASDVPGVSVPIFLAGAPVTGYFAFGPTTGAALNVTLVSYQGVCCVSCTIDTAAVPDPEKLMGCLHDGFDEVLGLGGSHRPVTLPLADQAV